MKMGSSVAFFSPEHSTEGKIFHLSKGYIVDKNIQCFEGCEKEIFSGGYYYIFSIKTDFNHLEEQIENMIPEVDYGWIKRNMLRTDFANRTCFYSYDGEKLHYCVPVIG